MTDMTIGSEYTHNFTTSGGVAIRTKFSPKNNDVMGKLGTVERAQEIISGAFNYIDQFGMGQAILQEVTKKDYVLRLWFVAAGNDALSPPGTQTNPTADAAVKWCPMQAMWFYDCGQSTARRNRDFFPNGIDGNLVVRPKNNEVLTYDDKNAQHVLGVQSSAAVLLHELGHLTQYFRKPQYFKTEFIKAWRDHQSHLVEVDGNMHMIPDIDAPWEVDNVNWHEQPFIKQARVAGLCEGYKSHYSDAVGADPVEDMEIVRVNGIYMPKVKVGGTWYHLNAAWKVKSETSVSQLYIQAKKVEQKRLINSLGGLGALTPPKNQIKTCYDKFIKS